MRSKIEMLLKKYRSQLIYLVFGVLTTVVNYLIYFPCDRLLHTAWLSNSIAWVFAVLFAYVTNKPFVFGSHDWSMKTVAPEFIKFVGTRVASLGVENLILLVTVDLLGWNRIGWKLFASVLVVILNYVGSKLLVFRKEKQ
ncbi:MAG: GtrA family protein [Candidatus Faecousia sp.]|nr:GtrA family protein [Bacillota bacterium]MDY4754430.1 GtrA family protein [Candidatus Faecousia sp.]MDY6160679.1 GtrA family protein [Candidatus Faecousia sp.]